jgi:probable F420-dependent oxidoreductase
MELGINIRNFGAAATPESLLAWSRFAEEAGFAVAMTSDHVAPTPDVEAIYPAPFYDPFVLLAWLAARTSSLRLGTTVTVLPLRHPLLTARLAANIDRLSGGRFVLGVGVGWSRPEYEALGVAFERRGRTTDECLDVITAFWTNDVVSADGARVAFRDVSTAPRPVQSPHVPIWVGGTSPAALRRAARYGQAWHPNNAALAWVRDAGLPALREAAASLGRPVPALCPRMQIRLETQPVCTADRPAGTGTLAQVRDDLEQYAALGAECVLLDTNPDDPHDRRPVTEDFRILATVAESWSG